jgi:hypothetical protein
MCRNILSVLMRQEYVFDMLMRQEYVFHMLMSAGICLSCADDGAGISSLF